MTDGHGNLLPIPERRSITKKLLRKVEPAERFPVPAATHCGRSRFGAACVLVWSNRSFASRIDQHAPYVAQHTAMRFTDSRATSGLQSKWLRARFNTPFGVAAGARAEAAAQRPELRGHDPAALACRSRAFLGELGRAWQAGQPPGPASLAAVLVCSSRWDWSGSRSCVHACGMHRAEVGYWRCRQLRRGSASRSGGTG